MSQRMPSRKTASKTVQQTPVREILKPESTLLARVRSGLEALEKPHRRQISPELANQFGDSLDLDKALQGVHPEEPRWDYLLGYTVNQRVIAVETHSAKEDQISKVIAKRVAALRQLRPHLKQACRIEAWIWVASGVVDFADTEIARRRLDQAGISFVGKVLLLKHVKANS